MTLTKPPPDIDRAIVEAAHTYGLDSNTMRAIASIESDFNPRANRGRATQYKGLFQLGADEWRRHGQGGDIYNARDNALAACRLMIENCNAFERNFKREPTDAEMYLVHQQGLGFYTRSKLSNIAGNPYPGMHGPQTHKTFEQGWANELMKRKRELTPP